MNLFEQVDGRCVYNPSTLQAIRDLKAGESLTIGGWLTSHVMVEYLRPSGESWEKSVYEAYREFFDAIQSSPGKIILLVPADQVGRVREVWLTEFVLIAGWRGEETHLKRFANVWLCLLLPEDEGYNYSHPHLSVPQGTYHEEYQQFCSLATLCRGLSVKVGDSEPVHLED